jgi:hypothetical protein
MIFYICKKHLCTFEFLNEMIFCELGIFSEEFLNLRHFHNLPNIIIRQPQKQLIITKAAIMVGYFFLPILEVQR